MPSSPWWTIKKSSSAFYVWMGMVQNTCLYMYIKYKKAAPRTAEQRSAKAHELHPFATLLLNVLYDFS